MYEELAATGNVFQVSIKPGYVMYVPCGYIALEHVKSESSGFRFACFPTPTQDSAAADLMKVVSAKLYAGKSPALDQVCEIMSKHVPVVQQPLSNVPPPGDGSQGGDTK